MNWNAYIDAYCERLLPGFWDEPLNAISNLAFLLAAGLVWWRWTRHRLLNNTALAGIEYAPSATHLIATERRWDLNTLLIMLVLIGLGSFAFHTFATRWAAALDVAFIALYLHFYLAVYAHRVLAVPWPRAAWGVIVFSILSQATGWLWREAAEMIGSSWLARASAASGYLGAWSVLLLVVAHSALKRLPAALPLALAAAAFAISLTLRQLDLPLCSDWRWGTHFAWHLLNALTLGLTSWAMVVSAGVGSQIKLGR
jgi:hypothetical protein